MLIRFGIEAVSTFVGSWLEEKWPGTCQARLPCLQQLCSCYVGRWAAMAAEFVCTGCKL